MGEQISINCWDNTLIRFENLWRVRTSCGSGNCSLPPIGNYGKLSGCVCICGFAVHINTRITPHPNWWKVCVRRRETRVSGWGYRLGYCLGYWFVRLVRSRCIYATLPISHLDQVGTTIRGGHDDPNFHSLPDVTPGLFSNTFIICSVNSVCVYLVFTFYWSHFTVITSESTLAEALWVYVLG